MILTTWYKMCKKFIGSFKLPKFDFNTRRVTYPKVLFVVSHVEIPDDVRLAAQKLSSNLLFLKEMMSNAKHLDSYFLHQNVAPIWPAKKSHLIESFELTFNTEPAFWIHYHVSQAPGVNTPIRTEFEIYRASLSSDKPLHLATLVKQNTEDYFYAHVFKDGAWTDFLSDYLQEIRKEMGMIEVRQKEARIARLREKEIENFRKVNDYYDFQNELEDSEGEE